MAVASSIYSAGSVTSKNALWVAISSTVAAICLFTSVMNREANSQVDTCNLESAVDALVETTSDAVSEQERAAQGFVNSLAGSLGSIHGSAFGSEIPGPWGPVRVIGNCERIDNFVNGD